LEKSSALTAGPSVRQLWLGLVLGAILRALLLPLPGSPDVGSWKTWSFAGAFDATGLYGVGGTPPERRLLRWQEIAGTTEYPPLALYEVAAVGRIYWSLDKTYRDSRVLTALIKAPGLLAEIVFVAAILMWGRRSFGTGAGRWIALAFWLNPAIILNGAALGYLDAQMAVPAALSMVAAGLGYPLLAGALLAAAILTKAQALFVGPVILLAILLRDRASMRAAWARFAAGGAIAAALILLPIVARGAWPNMVQAVSRLAAHDMLSGNALNAWWIVTWLTRAIYALDLGWFTAFTMPVRILGVNRFMEIGGPDAKAIGAGIVIVLLAWALWQSRQGRSLAGWSFVAGWSVFAYAMFSAQVHENHLYLAVPMLAVAAGLSPAYRPAFWAVSLISAFNMYIFYGLSDGWPSLISRRWTVIDITVLASFVSLGVFVWLTRLVARDEAKGQRPMAQVGG
jgi:hypothetical protein